VSFVTVDLAKTDTAENWSRPPRIRGGSDVMVNNVGAVTVHTGGFCRRDDEVSGRGVGTHVMGDRFGPPGRR